MEIFESTVQISAPIRDREKYLPSYLNCLYNLDYNKKLIIMRFLINDSKDNSLQIIENFKKEHIKEYSNIVIDIWDRNVIEDARVTNVRVELYEHFSAIRNKLLRTNESDFYFSVDSDIMVKKDTLKKLISHNVDAVAGLIINGYIVQPDRAKLFPNILNINPNRSDYLHISNWRTRERFGETLIPVDFTGAVVLMKKEITKNKNIKYASHYQGEDEVWSRTVRENGYGLFCDLSAKCTHLMTEKYLEMFLKGNFIFE